MSDSDQVEEKQFTCPRCGSHHFGTYDPSAGKGIFEDVAEGVCHGCSFTWLRKNDSYFRGTGRMRPRSVSGTSVRRVR